MPSHEVIGQVVSVHAGALRPLRHAGRELASGIFKETIIGRASIDLAGIEGDCQGDPDHHGGPDRALCAYPREHLPWLTGQIGSEGGGAPCGENLSTEGLLESGVAIGDRFRIGEVLVEVSVPRNPCHRLAARHAIRELPLEMERCGRTGFLLRVLEPGTLAAGDRIVRIEHPSPWATIAEANRLMHHDRLDRAGLRAMVELPRLAASWRKTFARRLATGACGDPSRRRYGE
ncbi:MAG: MOSC domain-containing protein [Thermoanaerobaculia bacterium]|nr:MOSC domain-containing protein [Thermoanaerobaculia bacterium]